MKCFVLALWLKKQEVWSTSSDAACHIESFGPKVQSWVHGWSLLHENSAERKRCHIVSRLRLSMNEKFYQLCNRFPLAWSALFLSFIILIAGIAYNVLSFYPTDLPSTNPLCVLNIVCLLAFTCISGRISTFFDRWYPLKSKKFCRFHFVFRAITFSWIIRWSEGFHSLVV